MDKKLHDALQRIKPKNDFKSFEDTDGRYDALNTNIQNLIENELKPIEEIVKEFFNQFQFSITLTIKRS